MVHSHVSWGNSTGSYEVYQVLVTWPPALYWQVFLFLPQVWTPLSVLWCAWEYTWGPKCTLYMRSVPASHLWFLWLRNSDRPLAHSPDAHSAHRSLLLLPVLTERQRCWGKWDKTAQKSCWYRLPGLDCWVNDPECVNCVRQCQRTVLRDGRTAALSFPTLMWRWHHSLASAHVLASQWRIYFISAQIKMMSWVCLEMGMEIMLNKIN